jgi:hypothetical protein
MLLLCGADLRTVSVDIEELERVVGFQRENSSCTGTLTPYSDHFFVATGTDDWPSDIAEMPTELAKFWNTLKKVRSLHSARFTLCALCALRSLHSLRSALFALCALCAFCALCALCAE